MAKWNLEQQGDSSLADQPVKPTLGPEGRAAEAQAQESANLHPQTGVTAYVQQEMHAPDAHVGRARMSVTHIAPLGVAFSASVSSNINLRSWRIEQGSRQIMSGSCSGLDFTLEPRAYQESITPGTVFRFVAVDEDSNEYTDEHQI